MPIDTSNVDMNLLMGRIRSFVLAQRIRVKEFFQDMDPLNSGFITKQQFIRCMSSFGCSSIGLFNITRVETEALCREYINPLDTRKVNWKRFEDDVESVFTVRHLEKNPNLFVAPQNIFVMPPAGTISWTEEKKLNSSENYRVILRNLKDVIDRRRLDVWPPFKDFDKLNRSHVTLRQFEQCLSKLGLNVAKEDLETLEAKFVDNVGFHYVAFLNELQPNIVEEPKYEKFMAELHKLSANEKGPFESNSFTDVQSILLKIKDQVYKKRVSIYEWLRDHDKLNSGRLTKETFKRAINLCNIDIQPSEIDILIGQ
jgi:Ca2+-binding EF-hand superfamily protein